MSDRKVHYIAADLSDVSAVSETAKHIVGLWPDMDVLAHNAGAALFSPFEKVLRN